MQKIINNKILSFVVVFALFVGIFCVPYSLFVGAAEITSKNNNAALTVYDVEEAKNVLNDQTLVKGDNLIYKNTSGKLSYYETEGGEEKFATDKQNEQLLPLGDGKLYDKSHNDISISGAISYNFTWDLTGSDNVEAIISEFWFVHRSEVGNWGFRVNKYEVRIANTVADLSKESALVATVEGITDGEQYNKINFTNAVAGRYLRVSCLKFGGDKTARVGQIVAFGKTEPNTPRGVAYAFSEAESLYTEDLATGKDNLLKDNTSGVITYKKQNGKEYTATTTQSEMLLNLTDGVMTDKVWHDINIDEAKTYSFTWDLTDGNSAWKSGEVSDIWIRWNSQEREREHRVSFFDVYAANSLEDLNNESNKIAGFEHISATDSCHRIMFDTPLTTKYIRIVPLRMTGDTCVRVNEISVIGRLTSALTYTEYNSGLKVMGYTGTADVTRISIPSIVDGKKVVAIGDDALVLASNLQYLYIPDTVTEISETALPDSVSTVSGGWNSVARTYANSKGILFEPDVYDFSQDHSRELLSEGKNLLSGAGAVAYKLQNGDYSAVASNLQYINDNKVETTYGDTINFPYYNSETESFNEMYADFVFDTGGMNEIEKILYVGHNFTELRTAEYQIYVSESSDTENLFQQKNLLINFKNTRNSKRQIYTLKEKIKARIIGLRIIKPAREEAGADYAIRVREFAVYGTMVSDNISEFTADNLLSIPKELGENMLNSYMDVYTKYNDDSSSVNTLTVGTGKLFDGSFSTFAHSPNATLLENCSYDIAYDLGCKAKINAILIGNYVDKDLRGRKIEIYASNDFDSLFLNASKIQSYDNEKAYRRLIWKYKNAITCKYIGFRIYSLVNAQEGEAYPRIAEIGVYGKYTDSKYDATSSRTELIFEDFKNSDIDKISKSQPINFDTVPLAIRLNETTLDKVTNTNVISDKELHPKKDLGRLSFENGVELGAIDGSDYVDVVWGYGKYYEFKTFMHYGSDANIEGPYHTGWYQVFVGENIYDVTKSENMVYEYRYDRQGKSNGQIVDLKGANGEYPVGKCIAVRILNPVSTEDKSTNYIGCRIAEMLIWGSPSERKNKPANLVKDVIYSAYFLDGDDKMPLEETEFNKDIYNCFYDGIYSKTGNLEDAQKSCKINADEKSLIIDVNLCSNMQIDKVLLKLKQDVGYKIYGSLKLAEIENKESLIFSHTVGSATTKKFSKTKTIRYIKIVFDEAERIIIEEFGLIGSDEQLRNYHNILRQNGVALSQYVLSNEGKITNIVNSNTEVWARLNDQENLKTTVIEGGNQSDGDTLNVMVDFCALKAIDRIKINYLTKAMIYLPYQVNYYIGTDYSEVATATKPDYRISGLPADETGDTESADEIFHDIKFQMQYARYLRIEFSAANYNTDYFNQMVVAVNEIRTFGIDVDGTAKGDSENRIFTHTDKKYGITVDVIALNESDIYEEISYAKITKHKLTAEQLIMLEGESLESVGNYYYQIAFYNAKGKKIKDHGRDMQIKFNCGKNTEDYSVYYLPNNDEAYSMLSEGYGTSSNPKIISFVYNIDINPSVYNFGLAKAIDSNDNSEVESMPDYSEQNFMDLQDQIIDTEEIVDTEESEIQESDTVSNSQKTEKKHKTKVKESAKNYYWIVILLCILISGIAVFFVLRFKKHKK